MSQIFIDPQTGRRYEATPDGESRWVDEQPSGLSHTRPWPGHPPTGSPAARTGSWASRHKVLTSLGGVAVFLATVTLIGALADPAPSTVAVDQPSRTTETVTSLATVTATMTITAAPSAAKTSPRLSTSATAMSSKPPVRSFRIPSFLGRSLSLAEDTLRDEGATNVVPVDISGHGRMVLSAPNWFVCVQEPAAGSRVKSTTEIRLGVVKYREFCP